MIVVALLWLACGDPQLRELAKSLEAYDDGVARTQRGDWPGAAVAFARAEQHNPRSPALVLWNAHALAEAGDSVRAVAVLSAGLTRMPDQPELRFNRAAMLARQDRLADAARDVEWLVRNGHADPYGLRDDPDIARLADDPSTAPLVPEPGVVVAVRGEGGSVLLGDRFETEFEITASSRYPVEIDEMGRPTGLLRIRRMIEDRADSEGILQTRTLHVTWDAVAAGEATVGPWLVRAGSTTTVTEWLSVEVVELPGRTTSPPLEAPLVVPSTVLGSRQPPVVFRGPSGLWALALPTDKVQLHWDAKEPVVVVEVEGRENGQPLWRGYWVPQPLAGTVRIPGLPDAFTVE